ncbi:two-component response regulator 24-like [Mercurialis annua]|uniref:two-component response regulator 24-like n=1 Tax=Mercurialis annua TaxID=3986 RepID=UPI00215F316A|nr:two-component response regulator 24-like [Mercurialis annua]
MSELAGSGADKSMEERANSSGGLDDEGREARITALVVNDDCLQRMIHRAFLRMLGVESQEVKNGKEAVDIHRSENKFDLIIMDMDMPVMDGVQATKELRSMGVHSRILGLSSRTGEETKEFLAAGLDVCREKPLTAEKLISILHSVKQEASASEASSSKSDSIC